MTQTVGMQESKSMHALILSCACAHGNDVFAECARHILLNAHHTVVTNLNYIPSVGA